MNSTGFAPHYHLHFPTVKQNGESIAKYFKIIKKSFWIHMEVGGRMENLEARILDQLCVAKERGLFTKILRPLNLLLAKVKKYRSLFFQEFFINTIIKTVR